MGATPRRHSNREWEGGGWHENPLIHISSEESGGGGCESPPSLVAQVGGWWLPATRILSERGGGWQVKPPSRISSEEGGAGGCAG